MKVLGRIAIILVGVVLVAALAVYVISEIRLAKEYDPVPTTQLSIPASNDSVALEKGKHLATAILKCAECHGDDMGGRTMLNEPSTIGVMVSTNLTSGSGGIGKEYRPEDWVRAVRYGLARDNRGLKIMPSSGFYPLSDNDLGAVVAYIQSLPPVDSDSLPETALGPVGRALFVFGALPLFHADMIDRTVARSAAPPVGVTVEYGKHLAEISGCVECHGPQLSGGKMPGTPPNFPPAMNITPEKATGIGNWTEADFFRALREGKRPDNTMLDPIMPWKYTAMMKDDEIRAIWLYLQTVAPRAEGNR